MFYAARSPGVGVKIPLGCPGPRFLPSPAPPFFVKDFIFMLLPGKMAAATPDLCLHFKQKEYGQAKGNASSAAFKKSTLKLYPALHLHLIGHKWSHAPL